MNNTGDLMTINDINFQAHIEDDEAKTDDFKIMYNQFKNVLFTVPPVSPI